MKIRFYTKMKNKNRRLNHKRRKRICQSFIDNHWMLTVWFMRWLLFVRLFCLIPYDCGFVNGSRFLKVLFNFQNLNIVFNLDHDLKIAQKIFMVFLCTSLKYFIRLDSNFFNFTKRISKIVTDSLISFNPYPAIKTLISVNILVY